jgi:hypothetical protein
MMNKMKKLIAYYSRAGNNYVGGKIMNLAVGNTEVTAKMIQKPTGSDIFRIDTVKEYPADYHETMDVAKQELRQDAWPELARHVDNMANYSVMYLGYPNWRFPKDACRIFTERPVSRSATVSSNSNSTRTEICILLGRTTSVRYSHFVLRTTKT